MRQRERQNRELTSANGRLRQLTTIQDSSPESSHTAASTLDRLPSSTMTRQLRQAAVLRMQQTHGNRAVRRMVAQPNDEYQQPPVTNAPSASATPFEDALASFQQSQTLPADGNVSSAPSGQPSATDASSTPPTSFEDALTSFQQSQGLSADGNLSSAVADKLKDDHSTGQSSPADASSTPTTSSDQAVTSWQQSQTLPVSGDLSNIDWDEMRN